jgi:biotin carboxyl carrier protein
MRYLVRIDSREMRLELDSRERLWLDGALVSADVAAAGESVWSVIVEGTSHEVVLLERDPLRVRVDGRDLALALIDEREQEASARAGGASLATYEVRAPMPGLILAVHVKEGDVVEEGGSVCTLEAMKMENELTVPRRARVTRLAASRGAKVNGGDLLAVLAPE